VKQVFATGAAAREPRAPVAVISALDPNAAPLVGMPSQTGTELGRELLAALRDVPAARHDQVFEVLSRELGASVSSMDEARGAVQIAAGEEGKEPALERALTAVRGLTP
jgi:hypothetical protein